MTDHRNWALVTLGLFIISTGWQGAENVYRYSPGIISLPQAERRQSHTEIQVQSNLEELRNRSIEHAAENQDSRQH